MRLNLTSSLQTLFKIHVRHVRGGSGVSSASARRKISDETNDEESSSENYDERSRKHEIFEKENYRSRRLRNLLDNTNTFGDLESRELNNDIAKAPYPFPKFVSDIPRFKKFDQSKYSFRPSSTPASQTSVVLFPGQGTQYVGMGKKLIDYPNVKNLFENAKEILGYDLLSLCLNGPKSELDKTIFCQPAVFVCSLAAVEKLRSYAPEAVESCVATAGFSVGEYAALVFAGSLSFEEALKLVQLRAEAMQACSETEPSGLMTVFLRHDSKLNLAMEGACEWAKSCGIEDPVCQIANYLFTNCKVIGGHEEALKFVETKASEFHLRCKRIPVSGAFHTKLMLPAGEKMKKEITKYNFVMPKIKVHSNINGDAYTSAYSIVRSLVEQIYKPVQWEMTMTKMYDFSPRRPPSTTFECGPGKQLGAMLKQMNADTFASYKHIFDD